MEIGKEYKKMDLSHLDKSNIIPIFLSNLWLILGTILIAVIVSIYVSTRLIQPVYEVEMIYSLPHTNVSGIDRIGMSVQEYDLIAKSDSVLKDTIKRVKFENEPSVQAVRSLLTIIFNQDTGTIDVKTQYSDPTSARKLAYSWRESFNAAIYTRFHNKIDKQTKVIKKGLDSLESSVQQIDSKLPFSKQKLALSEAMQLTINSAFGEEYVKQLSVLSELETVNNELHDIVYTQPEIIKVPTSPSSPSIIRNVIVSGLLGGILGIIVSFVKSM